MAVAQEQLCAKATAGALSGAQRVVSVAYVRRDDDYWLLFIARDSDRRGDVTRQPAGEIARVERSHSVPLLDAQIRHASTARTPPGANVVFTR